MNRVGALIGGPELAELAQLARRHNPKRSHLLVSTVLGKHIPVEPGVVLDAGGRLGRATAARLGDRTDGVVVLGFAETATGLGHCVAEALAAPYLHSTRRAVPGVAEYAGFDEEHSHAVRHRLLPTDADLLRRTGPLVLVDDELSTGRTAANTIRALHVPGRRRYVVATLIDTRHDPAGPLAEVATDLGVEVDVVALATGRLVLGDEPVPADRPDEDAPAGPARADVVLVHDAWPAGVRVSARHGFTPRDARRAREAAAGVARRLQPRLAGPSVLVLGTEELMWVPTLIAAELAGAGLAVRTSSTTRSPVRVLDEPGYPIRQAVAFTGGADAADGPGRRWAYNVDGFDEIVVVTDRDQPELVAALRPHTSRVTVVSLPDRGPGPPPLRGPHFGSYPAADVGWLLTDLSRVALEAPTEQREEAIQAGRAHYAESLPVEYHPDADYRALYDRALESGAGRIAHAVGTVTELVLAERGTDVVLASLARAGTPIGILMRRWAQERHGLDLPHYAVSIVRGGGIDRAAMAYLANHHEPGDVVFVDGWTGKGAIARELRAALDELNAEWHTSFDPALAVLADPGSCVRTFGTRDDFLVPSACLNSTVSGLVSRTVRNADLIAPGAYDGAKFYADLAADDVSAAFVDAVCDRFAGVREQVARDQARQAAGDREPTWRGWAQVAALATEYGVEDVNLVKPGVGETTRVLLRRVPWLVLVRPDAGPDLDHVRLLARRRGVPVREVPGLAYSSVGIIHPRFTRGATGADGRAVRPVPASPA